MMASDSLALAAGGIVLFSVAAGMCITHYQASARRKAARLYLSLASNPTNEGTTMSLIVNLTPTKMSDVIDFTFRDAEKHVTQHHGAVTVAGDNDQVFTVALDPSGNSATVTATTPGLFGSGTVTVTDAADNILATATVNVTDGTGEATTLDLSDADSEAAATAVGNTGNDVSGATTAQ